MYLIFKIKKHPTLVGGTFQLNNLDFKMRAESLNVFSKNAKWMDEDLEKCGYCYVYRIIEMTDIREMEYLVINEDFDFHGKFKKRHKHHAILSFLREWKINEIIN